MTLGHNFASFASRQFIAIVVDDGEELTRTRTTNGLDFAQHVLRAKNCHQPFCQTVYPADIEATIVEHAAVHEVAVVGVSSRKWGETPLAVVVLSDGASINAGKLTSWSNRRLGRQQRIADTIIVDELPRNPNGKILKRELRKRFANLDY